MRKRHAPWAAWWMAAFALSCQESQGLHYDRVSVRALHEDGASVVGFPSPACTTLPLLLGSRVVTRAPLGHITVVVDADRDIVSLSFEGATRKETIELTSIALDRGVERSIAVQDAATGERYLIVIAGGCVEGP